MAVFIRIQPPFQSTVEPDAMIMKVYLHSDPHSEWWYEAIRAEITVSISSVHDRDGEERWKDEDRDGGRDEGIGSMV